MYSATNSTKSSLQTVWVRDARTGNTYICPKSSIKDRRNVSSSELRECVDESDNPQNN
jgi:hypothetical protein